MTRQLTIALLSFGLAVSAAAQVAVERRLIPVYIQRPVPGAYGSLWSSTLLVKNGQATPTRISPVSQACTIGVCLVGRIPVPPQETIELFPYSSSDRPATILEIDAGSQVALTLRVRDLSRQSETWGTAVPIPHDADFRADRVTMLDVPASTDFRSTLRVYDIDGRTDARVRISLTGIGPGILSTDRTDRPDPLLAEFDADLRPPFPLEAAVVPGYLEIADIARGANLGGYTRIAIEVLPLTSGLRVWAFVAVIHNESQHLTVIAPH